MTTIELLGSIGGVGAVMGFLIFLAYKYLVIQIQEDRKLSENRLTGLLKDYNEICRANAEATKDLTRVSSELYTYLKMRNGHPK